MYLASVDEPPGPHDPEHVIMPALLSACPSFEEPWREHLHDQPGSGVYTDLGAFATHLVALLDRDETTEFQAVFAAVERYLRGEDDGIRYAMKIGLLETLGNIAANQRGWPWAARFRQWFGPAAASAWDDIHTTWGTSDSGDTTPAN